MALVWQAGAVLAMASGLLMAALGALLLLANPRKDWNRVFALLAVFWGAQILAVNTVRVTTDADTARLAGEVGLAFAVPLYFFVVSFAAIFPRPRAPFGTSGLAVGALALPAGIALAALFAGPASLIAAVAPSEGAFTLVWGPLFPPLVVAPLYGALFYALFVMMRRLGEAPSAIERRQVALVLAALVLFVAHNTPLQLAKFGAAALELRTAPEAEAGSAAVIAGIMVTGFALLATLAAMLLARLQRSRDAAERAEAALVLGSLAAGFLSSMAVLAVRAAGGPTVELLGAVRTGSVALVVYAVVRYQLFDIDLRLKHGATAAAALLAGGVLAAAAWIVLQAARAPPSAGGMLAVAVAAVSFVPLLRASTRLADRVAPGIRRGGEYLYLRKLEVYRAAVEGALRLGRGAPPDEPGLVELRAKLALTEEDHGLVVSMASQAPQGPAALRPGAVAFGKYAIDAVLAEGGFGRVFLARDQLVGRPVVVKELLAKWRASPEVVQRFLREAQIAGQLQHPNIVAVYGVERQGQDHFVVMEYLPGGTLAERLRSGKLPVAEALRITGAVLEALGAAHAKGIVHRDVKPGNVLFGARGEVKLGDFGLAQLAQEEPEATRSGLTSAGAPAGTLQYMSPEQARGAPLDHRSDLYAVGAMLYRMLSGRSHAELTGLDELSARNKVASGPSPAPMKGLPPGLEKAVARALAREPAGRFRSAEEFARALAGP